MSRLVDADRLVKTIEQAQIESRKVSVLSIINDAPTINPSLNLRELTEEDIEKFKIIWQRANSKNLLAINEERPQSEWGKWIISEIRCPNCLEYFDPEWHSAEELKKCPNCGARMQGGEE